MWDTHSTRKPILLLRLSGLLLLRAAERALAASLFHDPPRSTRAQSQGTPQNGTLQEQYARHSRKRQNKRMRRAAAHSEQQTSGSATSAPAPSYSMGDTHSTRKPTSLSRLSGLRRLRAAERALAAP